MAQNIFVDFGSKKLFIGKNTPAGNFELVGELNGFNASAIILPEYILRSNTKLSDSQKTRMLANFNTNFDYKANEKYSNYKKWESFKMGDVEQQNDITYLDRVKWDVIRPSILGTLKKSKTAEFLNKFKKVGEKANLKCTKENYEKIFRKLLDTFTI